MRGGCGTRVVPADTFGREYVAGVDFSAVLVYLGAVDIGGAAAGFQVQAHAGEVGEFVGAPGTFGGFSDVC